METRKINAFSFAENTIDDITFELTDMTHLVWSLDKGSSGSAGCFKKSWEIVDGAKIYYKLSNYNSFDGITGHESVNEIIASRLAELLGIEHVKYHLTNAQINIDNNLRQALVASSKSFCPAGARKTSLELFYNFNNQRESLRDFIQRMGWQNHFNQLYAFDYIICNRDRHDANVEIISDECGVSFPAPLFDHGSSLAFSYHGESDYAQKFSNPKVQSIFGPIMSEQLLELMTEKPNFNKLQDSWRDKLFAGLDMFLTKAHQDVIWEMIVTRWKRYEIF